MQGKLVRGLGGAGMSALLMATPAFAQQGGASVQEIEVQMKKLQQSLDQQRLLVERLAGELAVQREQLRAMQHRKSVV